jgi:hypothetical protein
MTEYAMEKGQKETTQKTKAWATTRTLTVTF